MKFRCERDVLGRSARHRRTGRSRSGRRASRCCSGVRLELVGNQLELTGTDLELTIRVTKDSERLERRRHGRAGAAHRRHRARRSSRARSTVDGRRRRGAHHRPAGRSSPCAAVAADDFPRAGRAGRRRGDAAVEPSFAEALRQVVRAASTDDARPILTGVLHDRRGRRPAPGGHRLVPAGGARPAGHARAAPRARRCWCRRGR